MSNENKQKSECCKGFNDNACPCLDQETGERSCQTGNDADKKPENNGCGGCDCAPKP